MPLQSFANSQNDSKSNWDLELDHELQNLFNNDTYQSASVGKTNLENNNEIIDINDFISYSDDEKNECSYQNEFPKSETSQPGQSIEVSPYSEYISPVIFSKHFASKQLSNVLGRKTFLDSNDKKYSDQAQLIAERKNSVTPNSSGYLSKKNSNLGDFLSESPSSEKAISQYPCFDSKKIVQSTYLKRKKKSILSYKISSKFKISESKNESYSTEVKKEGRILKMISSFKNKQNKLHESEVIDNVSDFSENYYTDEKTSSESSTLKNRTRNGSHISLSAGPERFIASSMFKMPHFVLPNRSYSGSISSIGTEPTLNDQIPKLDLDLELSDASLAFKLARTRTQSFDSNIYLQENNS
ncbi:hypothetical protein QEN19_001788 [Hanseniaspora menglaensis]